MHVASDAAMAGIILYDCVCVVDFVCVSVQACVMYSAMVCVMLYILCAFVTSGECIALMYPFFFPDCSCLWFCVVPIQDGCNGN